MDDTEVTKTREEALELLDQSQKADALDRVWQPLDNRDNDARLWELRGRILTNLKMHLEAVRSYDRALELDPLEDLLPYIWNNRGISLFALERYEEAKVAFSEASRRKWKYLPQAFNNRGLALMKLDHPIDALKDFEKAAQSEPTFPEAFNNRGQAFECLGKLPEALASYNKALQQHRTQLPAPLQPN
jgi:tetratricopeptide (TPR) repeat protein